MIQGELREKEKLYNSHWRAYSIITRMRWFAFILGPVPLIWDNVLQPLLLKMNFPEFVTMEDMVQILIFDILPLEKWIDRETFERIWPHIMNVSTVLFVVFIVWTIKMRRNTKLAAREVVEAESRVLLGGFRER